MRKSNAKSRFKNNSAVCGVYILGIVALPSAIGAKKTVAVPEQSSLEEHMLSHVERILVVDTIEVDRFEFFRHYRIAPSAGTILSGEEVKRRLGATPLSGDFAGQPFTGFSNEFADYMIWAQEDTTGYLRLAESVRLSDGKWSSPEFTPSVLNAGKETEEDHAVAANAAFPFMQDDGQTLYFASDNGESLGGYDIFVATRDPSDGEFLIPGNLGMPFNSPFDDYMLAIDRQTGVGWWASDRNQLGDRITIYIFALTDERVNVDIDDEQLHTYATLSGWESLLEDDQMGERNRLRSEISKINRSESRRPEFLLPMPGGVSYHYFTDFKNPKAATQMQLYLGQKASLEMKEKDLAMLRTEYAGGKRSIGTRIQTLEQQLRKERAAIAELLSQIYKLETGTK